MVATSFSFSLDAPKRIIVEELEPTLPLAICELVADFAALYQPEHRLRLLAVDLALQTASAPGSQTTSAMKTTWRASWRRIPMNWTA